MTNSKKNKEPSLVAHSLRSLFQEIKEWQNFIFTEWPLFLMMAGGITMLLFISDPLPPRNVYMAVGQQGSSFEQLGNKFKRYFEAEGITLHFVYTDGNTETMQNVSNPKSNVTAAFALAGMSSKFHHPNLQTLGSIEYVPLWLFHRGKELDTSSVLAAFGSKKVAIGPVGSGTSILTDRLLSLTSLNIDNLQNFVHMGSAQATQQIIDGEVFAMFIADAENGPNLQRLLKHEDIHPFNFEYAQAISKKLPLLIPVVLPKGSLDLKTRRPAKDVNMLATTATLLIKKDTHPAIQHIFMVSAEYISRDLEPLFSNPDFFPAYLDRSFPLSPIAHRYYERGAPVLMDKLPLWVVSYLDKIWLLLVGSFAIIFPIAKLFPNYRRNRAVLIISNAYVALLDIERLAVATNSVIKLRALLLRLEELNSEMLGIDVMTEEMNRLYSMKGSLNTVRQLITNKIKELSLSQAT